MKLRLARLTIMVGLQLPGLNLWRRKTMVELGLAKLILVLGRVMAMVMLPLIILKLWWTRLKLTLIGDKRLMAMEKHLLAKEEVLLSTIEMLLAWMVLLLAWMLLMLA